MSPTPRRAVTRLVLSALTALAVVVSAQVALVGGRGAGSTTAAGGGQRLDLGVVMALSAGPTHVDPLPDGVDLDDPIGTAALYERAGLERSDVAGPVYAASASESEATAPGGSPSTSGLGAHVVPSCSGTGTDGKRVQPLYVRGEGTASRYGVVLPLLLNEVANVDDVFAVSAAERGGVRRVRWVHQDCIPLLPEVVVPDGALSSFGATINALKAQGYTDPARKYLAFADAQVLCGVGTLYNDVRTTGNLNEERTAYARVDAPCWSGSTSVAAHELTHNLGGVLPGAPHRTANGHCWDESDLMCYNDGSGAAMQTVCADSAQGQLLDCGDDDYFSVAPTAGSWLAQNWNTASSAFLDTVVSDPTITPAPTPPPTTKAPPTTDPSDKGRRTAVRGHWKGSNVLRPQGRAKGAVRYVGVLSGQLRLAGRGRNVAGERLTLQRRYGAGDWKKIGHDTTDRSGRVSQRDRPHRQASYRWVYRGNDQLQGSRSSRIITRR